MIFENDPLNTVYTSRERERERERERWGGVKANITLFQSNNLSFIYLHIY